VHPTYLSTDLDSTAVLSVFFFIFVQLVSEFNEQNSNKTCHMSRSECDLKMHVQDVGYSLP